MAHALWGGLALLIAAMLPLLWVGRALVAVVIDLVVGELVAFYAIQFLALSSAFWSLVLLGLTIDLRIRETNAAVDDAQTPT